MDISYEYWSPLLSSEITYKEHHTLSLADVTDEARNNQLFQNLVRNQVREVTDVSIRRPSNTRGPLSSLRLPFRSVNQEQSEAGSLRDPVLIPATSNRQETVPGSDSGRLPNQRNRRRKGRRRKPNTDVNNIQPAFSSFTNIQAPQNPNSRAQPTFIHEPHLPIVAPVMEPIPRNRLQQPMIDPMVGMFWNSIPEFNVTDIMFPAWKIWQFTPCSRSCGGGESRRD